jgi:hypothetical protein
MDQRTKDNWKKIKEVMEKSGKTDNYYYVRACKILNGQKDPFDSN